MASKDLGNTATPQNDEERGLKTNPPKTEALADDLDWDRPGDPDNARHLPLW